MGQAKCGHHRLWKAQCARGSYKQPELCGAGTAADEATWVGMTSWAGLTVLDFIRGPRGGERPPLERYTQPSEQENSRSQGPAPGWAASGTR